MNCILIGNGTSVLDKKLGETVNSFDRVVRFNSYKTKGFEPYCGDKVTDWFNVQYFLDEDFRLKRNYHQYVFHSWSWNPRPEKYRRMSSLILADTKKDTEESTLKEMWNFCPDSGYKWYSTGAIATWMMLKEFESVSLFGFDWWDRKNHHYGDNEIRGNVHNPQNELLFFQKLGDRIEFL